MTQIQHRIKEARAIGTVDLDGKVFALIHMRTGQFGQLVAAKDDQAIRLDHRKAIPAVLRQVMARDGLTQKALSLRLGVHLDTLKKWLSGVRSMPYAQLRSVLVSARLISWED